MADNPLDLYRDKAPATRDESALPRTQEGALLTPFSLVIPLVAALMVAVVGWGIFQNSLKQPENGAAPDFTLPLLGEEGSFTLSEQRGKVVVINFWASWCLACRREAPMLQRTYEAYQDQGVIFLGIAVKDIESDSLAYIDEFNITYPNVMDIRGRMEDAYRITGVPETFIIDKDGNISTFLFAEPAESVLRGAIEEALDT